MSLLARRVLSALGQLALCSVLGILISACGGGGGGSGVIIVGTAPIGDISGGWVVSVLPAADECNPLDNFHAGFTVVQVIQNGNSIKLVAEDGGPLPEVVGGSVQGTLTGDQLSFSFKIHETEGVTAYSGTVTVGPNLRSFYSANETFVHSSFVHDTDPEQNCSGDSVWTGQLVDVVRVQSKEVAIPAAGAASDSLTFDEDTTIQDLKVQMAVDTAWGSGLRVVLSSPASTAITLQEPTSYNEFEVSFEYFNMIWSDTGRPFGHLTYGSDTTTKIVGKSGASFRGGTGCEMKPSGPGSLADFSGESTLGDWKLGLTDTFESNGTLNEWGLLVNLAPPMPNVSGDWLLRTSFNEEVCPYGAFSAPNSRVNIEQDGAEVTIRNGDGSPFNNIVGGKIVGSLSGATLPISFTVQAVDGMATYSGTLEFSDFLNGFRPRRLTAGPDGLKREFTQTGETEPLCSAADRWEGRPLPLSWEPELIACDGPLEFGYDFGHLHTIFVEEEIVIGEVMVLVDLSESWLGNTSNITVTSPDETAVTLFSTTQHSAERRLDVIWSDRGANYDDYPPIDGAVFGGQMEPAGPGELGDFSGESTAGPWALSLQTFENGTVNNWCLLVNDEPPPPPHVITVCAQGPVGYAPGIQKQGEGGSAFAKETISVAEDVEIDDVEVSTEITQAFIGDLFQLQLASPSGTHVLLIDHGVGSKADDLNVIWSDNGVAYGQFPEGDTTFGGLMRPFEKFGLGVFEAERSKGEWVLQLQAAAAGTLEDWCVMIQESD